MSTQPENISASGSNDATEVEKIARELVKVKADLEDINYEIEDASTDTSIYDAIIEEAQKKLREARQAKMAEENKVAGLKYNQNLLKTKVKDLENKLHKAERERMKNEEIIKHSAEIDKLAQMFPWFPYIKKHQFEAAKQIAVTGGRTVLGDKRGLGKSLTSLATVDLLGAKKVVIISKVKSFGTSRMRLSSGIRVPRISARC